MTKVKELREEALGWYSDPYDYEPATKAVDSLISAVDADAFTRGVAEGAEQVLHGSGVYVGHVINGAMFMPPNKPDGYVWIVPKPDNKWENASVLAPTKEPDHGNI